MEVKALVSKDGEQVGVPDPAYAGETSRFSGTWKAAEKGMYEAVVYAYHPADGNTGVDRVTFVVE